MPKGASRVPSAHPLKAVKGRPVLRTRFRSLLVRVRSNNCPVFCLTVSVSVTQRGVQDVAKMLTRKSMGLR